MEEDIKLLEKLEFIGYGKKEDIEALGRDEHVDTTTIIKNLINKYKELVKERDGIYADYQDLGKEKLRLEEKCEEQKKNYRNLLSSAEILKEASEEQEKIIELMAEYISGTDIDEDVCKKVGKNPFCDEFGEGSKCEECVIEFFRKKAKGE
jgi:hypothetical protein